MSKEVTRSVGRPPAPIKDYLAKINPHLCLGFSLPRACRLAKVPYRTVKDYYDKDESIRIGIDSLMDDVNLHARAKLVSRVKDEKRYDHKAVMDWLTHMDEDFKDNGNNTYINEQKVLIIPSDVANKYGTPRIPEDNSTE